MHSHRLSSSSTSISPPPSPLPNANSIPNKASRADQIVQSFYGKVVQVVLQSRVVPIPRDRNSPYPQHRPHQSLKQNRWFNLETDEVEAFKSAAKYWRNACVTEDPAPPLIIEIFLDASELVATQSVILVDERRLKHKLELNKVGRFYQLDKTVAAPKKTLLLESWCLLLSGPQGCQLELPTIYKLGISYFRSLQSFLKILPAASLHQRLKKSKRYGLKIGYRLSTTVSSIDSEIGFGPFASDDVLRTTRIDLPPFDTPLGKLRFAVTFRRLCDFHVEDSEMLLSARFQRGEDPLDAPLHLPSRNPFSYRTAQDSYAFGNFDKGPGTEDISQYHVQNSQDSSVTSLTSGVGAGFPFPAQPYTDSTSPGRSRNREVGTRSRPSSQDQDNFLGSKGSLGVAVFSSVKSSPPSHLASLRRPPSITMFSPFKSPSLSSSPSLHNASPPSRTSSFGNRSSTSLERGLFQPSNRVTPPSIRPTSPAPTKVSSSFGYRFGSFSGNPLSGEPGVPHSSSFRRTPSMRSANSLDRSQGPGSAENSGSLSLRLPNDDLTEFIRILSNPPAIKANIKPADAAPDLSFGKTLLDRYKQFQLRFEALTTELEACAAKSRLGLGPLLESPATSPLRKTGFKAEPSSSEARSMPNPIHDRLLMHCVEIGPGDSPELSSFSVPDRLPPRTSLLSQKLSTQKFTETGTGPCPGG